MWPFRRKGRLPGLTRDEEGNLAFELTEEEQQAIENTFKIFEGYGVHRDYADDIQKGTMAMALSNYAREQVMMCKMESQRKNRIKLLEKAIAAATKAYSFYQLPIYTYDLACFMEMSGRMDVAKGVFTLFLKQQLDYKPKQIDELFLRERDIDKAIEEAEAKAI